MRPNIQAAEHPVHSMGARPGLRRPVWVALALGVLGACLAAIAAGAPNRILAVAATSALFLCAGPIAGWWAWLASTLTQGVEVAGLGVSLNVLGVVAFWSGLAGGIVSRDEAIARFRLPRGAFAALLAVAYIYFSWASLHGWARNAEVAMDSWRHLTISFATATAGVGLFAGAGVSGRRKLAWSFVALAAWAAALGIAEFLLRRDLLVAGVDQAGGLFRINGVAPNPIVYGFHLAWAIPPAFYLACSDETPSGRRVALACLGAIALAAAITLNRQTLVLIGLLGGVGLLFMRGPNTRAIAGLALAATLVAIPTLGPRVAARFALLGNLHYDTSFKYRRDNFRVAREIVAAHPATGIGLGQYPYNWREFMPENLFYMQYDQPDRLFYNDLGYSQVATEAGLIGLALFLALIVGGGAQAALGYSRERGSARARESPESANWYAMILGFVIFVGAVSLVQDTFLRGRIWIVWAILAQGMWMPNGSRD